jgi:hypothetical protein
MRIGRGNRSTRRKPAPVPLCPPQIPHDLTRPGTRAPRVGSRRLTAWVMAGPKLKVAQLLKTFPTFYETQKFITVFTRALHWSLPWAKIIQSITPYPISLRSIFIFYSQLRLGLPSGLFPSTTRTMHLQASVISWVKGEMRSRETSLFREVLTFRLFEDNLLPKMFGNIEWKIYWIVFLNLKVPLRLWRISCVRFISISLFYYEEGYFFHNYD